MGALQQALASLRAVGGGGPTPQPTDLSDLQLWLPASSITGVADGGTIPGPWPDLSGNSRSITVSSVSAFPKLRTTGGPGSTFCVEFDSFGSPYFVVPNFLTGYTEGEYFAVIKLDNDPPATAFEGAPALGGWGTGITDVYPWNDNIIYDGWGSNARKTTNNAAANLAAWHVFNVRSEASLYEWSINGATTGNDFYTTASNTVAFSTTPRIGSVAGFESVMDGRIADIIFFSRVLDDTTERKAVMHAYLNATYGFSLPT